MNKGVDLYSTYAPSENVVAREIDGELIIVPLASGVGESEDELFTVNKTGRVIWDRLDERKSLRTLVDELASEYDSPASDMEKDVLGFVGELVKRRILVKV